MAETAFELWANRLAFAARQGGRVAWYAGHGLAVRRLVERMEAGRPDRPQVRRPSGPVPDMRRLLSDVTGLMARDLANVEAGLYPMPEDEDGDLPELIARSRAFFRDAPEVERRRREGAHQEVFEDSVRGKRPRYYLQNFHFQSGGWMSEESASLYDMQVEVLFSGAANAMRRQALAPIAEELRGRDQRRALFADIACGTGSFVAQARRAFPRLPALAIDLSESYLGEARRKLGRLPSVQPVLAKAEALPLKDGALDFATCIYLFHELPPKVRHEAAQEISRAMKPGGVFVLMDSLQTGDEPDYDGLLELFPQMFHEPYYAHYLTDDLEEVFADAGFVCEGASNAFFSKVTRFRKV